MLTRYHMRPDRHGYTVFDIWTAEPVCVALMPQTGLDREDATDLVELMNQLALRGDRLVHQ